MARQPPPPFAVEQWMDTHETTAKYNLAETCVASISIDELVALSENKEAKVTDILDTSQPQVYGEIRGSSQLRDNLSRLYSTKTGTPLHSDNIVITPGGISANHLVFYALLSQGDHVICQYPTYQQLYSLPASLGAEVSLWRCSPEKQWVPDFEDLKALVKENTRLIVLKYRHAISYSRALTLTMVPSNPINPSGAILPKPLLTELIDFAESKNLTIMSDEVYRPLFHSIQPMSPDFPPSILSMGYSRVIATGSMSKAYSLAGIRVGWVASRSSELIQACASARDYTTISVSGLDQRVAAFALGPDVIHGLLARNLAIAKANLALLDRFIVKHDEYCEWVKPVAGTTAFVRFHRDGVPVDAGKFCQTLQDQTGVMLLPGDVGFGDEFKGYVRFGYCNKTEVVQEGLEVLRKFMRKEFDDVPLS